MPAKARSTRVPQALPAQLQALDQHFEERGHTAQLEFINAQLRENYGASTGATFGTIDQQRAYTVLPSEGARVDNWWIGTRTYACCLRVE